SHRAEDVRLEFDAESTLERSPPASPTEHPLSVIPRRERGTSRSSHHSHEGATLPYGIADIGSRRSCRAPPPDGGAYKFSGEPHLCRRSSSRRWSEFGLAGPARGSPRGERVLFSEPGAGVSSEGPHSSGLTITEPAGSEYDSSTCAAPCGEKISIPASDAS